MTEKIQAVGFKINWSESNVADTHTIFKTWRHIGQHIRAIALNAPKGGAYDKTNFTITFADEGTYNGRLDIQHFTMPYPGNENDLAQHVNSLCRFYTGELCPNHMTEEDYQNTVNNLGPEIRKEYADFLETYDIPETDGVVPVSLLFICLGCQQPFIKVDLNRLCGRCLYDQEAKDAERKERDEARAAKEADPLYPILREGRTAVTKKMRQLLRQRSGKTWSVTGGRGTGWGWLDISAPPSRLEGYRMIEADRIELAELLGKDRMIHCQGESVSPDNWWPYLLACRGDYSND